MFSVVIPLWNKRHTIAATVAAALAQSWRAFELIVVDDGSTDGSMDRLARFDDSRIRRLAQPNAGPGAARNLGIQAAAHDWIAFLDADDVWLPGHLAELNRLRTRHPNAGLIGTSFVGSDRKGRYRSADLAGGTTETIDLFERFFHRRRLSFCTSSSAIHKSAYLALGGFGRDMVGEDVEYWVRIALERQVAISTRVTVVYRRWTGGISDTLQGPWRGRELREVRDIGPWVATLVQRYPEIGCPETQRKIDGFIDTSFSSCVRHSAYIGDLRTLRAARKAPLRPLPVSDRLLLAISSLPRPFALPLYRLGVALYLIWKTAWDEWRQAGRPKERGRIAAQDPLPGKPVRYGYWRSAARPAREDGGWQQQPPRFLADGHVAAFDLAAEIAQ